ncbi:SpoIIE family protein phosphatase [Fundidesulfovibrio butyratiphilus]
MQPLQTKKSLRAQFNLAVALMSLAVVAATALAFAWASRSILGEFAAKLAVKQAQLERNKLLSLVERELTLARALAADPEVRRFVTDESDPAIRAQAFEELENYRSLFRDHSYFVVVDKTLHYLINHDGHLESAHLSKDQTADRWYFQSLDSPDDYALNLDFNRTIQAAKVWFNVVVKDDQGRRVGQAGTGLDLTDFLREAVNTDQPGVTPAVVDRAGVIMAHPDPSLAAHNAVAKTDRITLFTLLPQGRDKSRLAQALLRLSNAQTEVESFPVTLASGAAHAAVAAIPEIGWYDVVLVDQASVMGWRVFGPLAGAVLVCLAAVMAGISLLTGRLVLRPLSRLTRASGEMAQGRYGLELPVDRRDEIGQLTASFNTMSAKVQDAARNLENLVEERTAQLTAANQSLTESRQAMLESLRYARVIQTSILPRPEHMAQVLGEHLALYRPRDIVGGDLIHLSDAPDHFLLGVIDCTGHGVPGAFMAMTAHSVLNHVTAVVRDGDPARILAETDRVLRHTLDLRQDGPGGVDCGLDMALVRVDKTQDRLVFAGAGLPLFLVDQRGVTRLKGQRRRVGYRGRGATPWTNQTVDSLAGRRVYASTDGFWDQGDDAKGYGFGLARFESLLTQSLSTAFADQARTFQAALDAYRGASPQRDDIAVVGFAWHEPSREDAAHPASETDAGPRKPSGETSA